MEKSKRGYSGFRPDIVAALANREFMRVLDVGCGEGKLGAQLKVLNPATVVCGVDGDEELLVKAEANLDFCWKVDLSRILRNLDSMLSWSNRSGYLSLASTILDCRCLGWRT